MQMYGGGGVEIWLHAFLISALDGDEWLASCLGRFIPEEGTRYPLDRRLGGPQNWSERRGAQ
jgi:hypothetical protein